MRRTSEAQKVSRGKEDFTRKREKKRTREKFLPQARSVWGSGCAWRSRAAPEGGGAQGCRVVILQPRRTLSLSHSTTIQQTSNAGAAPLGCSNCGAHPLPQCAGAPWGREYWRGCSKGRGSGRLLLLDVLIMFFLRWPALPCNLTIESLIGGPGGQSSREPLRKLRAKGKCRGRRPDSVWRHPAPKSL